jgi:hypothetical protein
MEGKSLIVPRTRRCKPKEPSTGRCQKFADSGLRTTSDIRSNLAAATPTAMISLLIHQTIAPRLILNTAHQFTYSISQAATNPHLSRHTLKLMSPWKERSEKHHHLEKSCRKESIDSDSACPLPITTLIANSRAGCEKPSPRPPNAAST